MTRLSAMLKKRLPPKLRRLLRDIYSDLFDGYCIRSYSQEGEDLILEKLFANRPRGFYVDVGAHHPKRFSNTYLFYKRGWRGINIDAMPGSMRAFVRTRPRDVNLEVAVSDTAAKLVYHAFCEPALNGFSAELSQQRAGQGNAPAWTKTLTTRTLRHLLAEYLPEGQNIDFLSVDVEGHDFEVLRSMDWSRHRPKAVVVELSQQNVDGVLAHPIHHYLGDLGYVLYAKLCNSCVYVSEGAPCLPASY
jgi:FkbM family methyltransferase